MEILATLLVIIAVTAVPVLVARFWWERTAERAREMQSVAARLGWRFSAHASFDSIPAVRKFPHFADGTHRRIRNFMSGLRGERQVAVFDYEYVDGYDRSSRRVLQTVVHVHTPDAACPRFELRPENARGRIGTLLGEQGIDLQEHPESSGAYVLQGLDEATVRGAFTPGVADFFAGNPSVHAEASGPDLFFWYGTYVNGHEVPALLDDALGLAARLQAGSHPPPADDAQPIKLSF